MSDLQDLLVAEAQRLQPTAAPSFDALVARGRRRRIAWSLAVGVAAVAVAATATTALVATAHGGADRSALEPAGPVVSQGECAGLKVTATLVGRPERWPLRAGAQP